MGHLYRIACLWILALICHPAAGQNVGIGTDFPNIHALLELDANDAGLLIPRMTTAERDANITGLGAPEEGLLIYNLTTTLFNYWDGSAWVSFPGGSGASDHDWYKEGGTSAPNSINDEIYTFNNVGIGLNTPDYLLHVSQTAAVDRGAQFSYSGAVVNASAMRVTNTTASAFRRAIQIDMTTAYNNTEYGLYTNITSSGSGGRYGIYNDVAGSSTNVAYGMFSDVSNSGNGDHWGVDNRLSGAGTGTRYGTRNVILGAPGFSASAAHYGTYNALQTTNTGSFIKQYGVFNSMAGNANGIQYGVYNFFVNDGIGTKYGSYTEFDNSLGSAILYGNYVIASTTLSSTTDKYGYYVNFPSTVGGGTHYGVFSDVRRASSYSGYFLGTVYIGTNTLNGYRLPVSDGTAAYVPQTNGAGTMSWVDPATFPSDNHLKKKVQPLRNSLKSLQRLNTYSYTYEDPKMDERMRFGFLASEVKDVFPNLVVDAEEGYRRVDYISIIPVAVDAIREQQETIELLETRLKDLEKKYDVLLRKVEALDR